MLDLKIQTNGDFILIEIPNNNYISYKYEIYGNNKFFSSGILESLGDQIPYITFKLDSIEDTIFFIKVLAKKETMTENDLYFSFYNHEETKTKKNLIMEIREPNFEDLSYNLISSHPRHIDVDNYSENTELSETNLSEENPGSGSGSGSGSESED